MNGLVKSLILSLLLTEAFEIPFCAAAWKFGARDIGVCALVNVVTNPPVVLIYSLMRQWLFSRGAGGFMPAVIAVLEVSAVLAEWLFYRGCTDKKRPFLISLTANAFSYGAGLLINLLLN